MPYLLFILKHIDKKHKNGLQRSDIFKTLHGLLCSLNYTYMLTFKLYVSASWAVIFFLFKIINF